MFVCKWIGIFEVRLIGLEKYYDTHHSKGIIMSNKELLIDCIHLFSEEKILSLDVAPLITIQTAPEFGSDRPYCASPAVIRYGRKCGKQRFFCKSCEKTFISTTHTIIENSHFPIEICHEVIRNTVHDDAIDYTVKKYLLLSSSSLRHET